jgi:hypothetical protein
MTLKTRIQDEMKDAMRAKDVARLSTIRLLLAAIKQREVDERKDMADADVLSVLDKMVKQRKDSIAQFEAGKREDLAASSAPRSSCCRATCRPRRARPSRRDDRRGDRRDRRGGSRGHRQGDGDREAEARGARRHRRGVREGQGEARLTADPDERLADWRAPCGTGGTKPPAYNEIVPCRVMRPRGRPTAGRARRLVAEPARR